MVAISIIMPLYNAEKFLGECLNSIFAQDFQDFELICIDDCSTDGTMDILQTYCKSDDRMRIFSNKEHKGAAFSRNRGIDEACGRYLLFLDGDDVFHEKLFLLAYNKAVESHADVVVYQSICITSDKIHQRINKRLNRSFIQRYCNHTFAINNLNAYEYLLFSSVPWDKMYKKDFILKEKLKFQDLSCCNDCYFVNMALLLAEKIIYLNTDEIMVYARMHNTPSRISYKRDPMCSYWAELKVLEELSEREKMEMLFQHYYTRLYFHLYMVVKNTIELDMAKQFYIFLQKDGIVRLQRSGSKYYSNLNTYIKEGISKFLKESYESGWYEQEDIFQIALYYNVENIQMLFERWNIEGKRIGLWGIDRKAEIFLRFCHRYHLWIDQMIDRDIRKQGRKLFDFPEIGSPDSCCAKVQVILFTKDNVMEEAEKMLGSNVRSAELFNVVSYLEIYE